MSSPFDKPNPFRTTNDNNFKAAHEQSDVDVDRTAMHHTLGTGPTEAAAGNHKHTYVSDYIGYNCNPRPFSGAWTSFVIYSSSYYTIESKIAVVELVFQVTTAGTGGGHIIFDLPFPWKGNSRYIGSGREDAASGKQLQVMAQATGSVAASMWDYNNASIGADSGRVYQVFAQYRYA